MNMYFACGEGSANMNTSNDESITTGDESVETRNESIHARKNIQELCYNAWIPPTAVMSCMKQWDVVDTSGIDNVERRLDHSDAIASCSEVPRERRI